MRYLSQAKYRLLYLFFGIFAFFPSVTNAQTKLQNPLAANNLQEFLIDVVDSLVILSIPIIVFFIIYAGFVFVTSGGDASKIETAKKTALYTVIGAAVILGASLLGSILEGTFSSVQNS